MIALANVAQRLGAAVVGGYEADFWSIMSEGRSAQELFDPKELGHQTLTRAILHGRSHMVSALLRAGAHPDGLIPELGRDTPLVYSAAPLYAAAMKGDEVAVQALLDAGAVHSEVPVSSPVGGSWWFPTFAAVKYERPDVLRMLLRAGANPDAVGVGDACDNDSGLLLTSIEAGTDFAVLLLKHGASAVRGRFMMASSLVIAATERNSNLLKVLMERAKQELGDEFQQFLDAQDGVGKTALHWAVEQNTFDCARLLFEAGASLDVEDADGRTPLQLSNSKILDGLLQRRQSRRIERDLQDVFSSSSEVVNVPRIKRGLSL